MKVLWNKCLTGIESKDKNDNVKAIIVFFMQAGNV